MFILSSNWNTADKTLLCSAFAFLAALGFYILHPNSIIAEGILFVTEAALVGGVADWFAVTALFKKPLGFPFHTAILPNRRQDFIDASVNMVQNEFFSRRSIFKKLSSLHLLPKLLEYLKKKDIRQAIIILMFTEIANFISKLDKEAAAKKISNEIRKTLRDVPTNILIHEVGQYLKKSGKDRTIFESLIKTARNAAATEETRKKIEKILENYANEHTQASSSFSMLMTGLAQMLDLVNFTEGASLMQRHLLAFLDELSSDSHIQREVLDQCRKVISEIVDTLEFRDLIYKLQLDTINSLPFENIIQDALVSVDSKLSKANVSRLAENKSSNNLPAFIYNFLDEQFSRLLSLLENDNAFRNTVEKFIFDLAARSALSARPIFANIAQTSLMNLSDDQLNSMVYNKAEEDFVWIRLNGSIVGSAIGLVIFIIDALVRVYF